MSYNTLFRHKQQSFPFDIVDPVRAKKVPLASLFPIIIYEYPVMPLKFYLLLSTMILLHQSPSFLFHLFHYLIRSNNPNIFSK